MERKKLAGTPKWPVSQRDLAVKRLKGCSLVAYWLLFAYFATGTMLSREARWGQSSATSLPILFGAIMVGLAIGLRYEVGGDWGTYKFLFSFAGFADLGRTLAIGDPGYQALNWLIQRLGLEIWAVNLICGAIFTWGLYRFAKTQPDPWLVFAVAVPYLIVVVAMGYTRQAVAIGIILAGLAAMERGASVVRFALYVAAAALFHRTAVVVLPLVILAGQRNKFLNALAGVAACLLFYDLFLADSVEGFVKNYVEAEYSSQGALVRVIMNLVPAVLFLLFRRRLLFSPASERVWRFFALAALLMPVLLILLPSSTAVDRLALYLIPLQVAVLPRIKYLIRGQILGKFLVLAYSGLVLFVWLNFAVHAEHWLPYRIYPF